MRTILMSIKAEHNANIESGRKTLELRKRIPRCALPIRVLTYESGKNGRHMVTNEWVCDYIRVEREVADGLVDIILEEESCVKAKEIIEYAGGNILHSMHISDLVIYDKPKELNEFKIICTKWVNGFCTAKCIKCERYQKNDYKMRWGCEYEGKKPITRPPQSWCYVEGVGQ